MFISARLDQMTRLPSRPVHMNVCQLTSICHLSVSHHPHPCLLPLPPPQPDPIDPTLLTLRRRADQTRWPADLQTRPDGTALDLSPRAPRTARRRAATVPAQRASNRDHTITPELRRKEPKSRRSCSAHNINIFTGCLSDPNFRILLRPFHR